MDDAQARALIRQAITSVAPDAAVDDLEGDDDIFTALEIDSMDLLNIAAAVHEKAGIDIPERDYGKLATLDDFARYLVERSR